MLAGQGTAPGLIVGVVLMNELCVTNSHAQAAVEIA